MSDQTVQSENTTDGIGMATRFLVALFGQAPGDQFLEIREIDGKGEVQQTFHPIEDLQTHGFAKALPIKSDGVSNVYYGVASRIIRRGTARDVTVAGAVWFDEITRASADLPPFSFVVETSPGKVQGGHF